MLLLTEFRSILRKHTWNWLLLCTRWDYLINKYPSAQLQADFSIKLEWNSPSKALVPQAGAEVKWRELLRRQHGARSGLHSPAPAPSPWGDSLLDTHCHPTDTPLGTSLSRVEGGNANPAPPLGMLQLETSQTHGLFHSNVLTLLTSAGAFTATWKTAVLQRNRKMSRKKKGKCRRK